ncbi:hypothetical protein D0T51_03305 [Parabacteroides sp. 52]|nr:hypothetical protein [Parabacteroides sp. 52]
MPYIVNSYSFISLSKNTRRNLPYSLFHPANIKLFDANSQKQQAFRYPIFNRYTFSCPCPTSEKKG